MYKSQYKGRKSGLFVNFSQFPCSWIPIRISIPNTDPDPGEPNQCGSGSEALLQTIHDVDGIRHSRKKSHAKRVK